MHPDVLDLRLCRSGPLALAVVRFGPVEVRGVRVLRREGRLRVQLPGVVLEEGLFRCVVGAVLAEYQRVAEADPWAEMRRTVNAR